MEAFLLHPLFIRIESENKCIAQTTIPDAEQYKINRPLHSYDFNNTPAMLLESALKNWLNRRRMYLLCPQVGIIDFEQKQLLVVDIVTEYMDEIVFLVIHATRTRCNNTEKNNLINRCRQIKEQTLKVFKFSPRMILINIFSNAQIHSTLVD